MPANGETEKLKMYSKFYYYSTIVNTHTNTPESFLKVVIFRSLYLNIKTTNYFNLNLFLSILFKMHKFGEFKY